MTTINSRLDATNALLDRHPRVVAAVLTLLFTLVVTWPGWETGRVFLGSTDNWFATFPNILLTSHSIKLGDPVFWNPFILGGIDFTGSTHNYLYSPFNWIFYLFPTKDYIVLQTFRVYLEIWAVGFFGYLFFAEEIEDSRWALFSAAIYQLCGFLYFSMTTYACLELYFLIPASTYLIWTLERRSARANYVGLVGCFVLALLCANVVYEFGAGIVIFICFLYRRWPQAIAPWRKDAMAARIFYAAAITAVMVAAIRLIPVGMSVIGGPRFSGSDAIELSNNRIFMVVMAAIPEAFGITMSQSLPLIHAIHSDGHAQFHGYTYFGTTAVAIVMATLATRPRKGLFWAIWALVVILWSLHAAPVISVVTLLTKPLIHDIIPKMQVPLPVSVFAGRMGYHLQKRGRKLPPRLSGLLLSGGVAFVAVAMIPWAKRVPEIPFQGMLLALIAATIVGYLLLRYSHRLFVVAALLPAAAALVAVIIIATHRKYLASPFFSSALFYVAVPIVAGGVLLAALCFFTDTRNERVVGVSLGMAAAVAMATLFGPFPTTAGGFPPGAIGFIVIVAIARHLLILAAVVWVLEAVRTDRMPSRFLPYVLMSFAVIELLPYNINYSRQITDAWVHSDSLYPNIAPFHSIVSGLDDTGAAKAAERNRLLNPSFEHWNHGIPAHWQLGGNNGRVGPTNDAAAGKTAVRVAAMGRETINLYQDMPVPKPASAVTFGAWVRAAPGNKAAVMLADGVKAALSPAYSGNGEWQWLTVSLPLDAESRYVRAHLSVGPGSTAVFDGAEVVPGLRIAPYGSDRAGGDQPMVPGFSGIARPTLPDLADYRVNRPNIFLGLAGNVLSTNWPQLYGLRTYGGVNSTVPRRLYNLIVALDPSEPIGGLLNGQPYSDSHSPLLSDLVGNGYGPHHMAAQGPRPTALSRFMLFPNFSVQPNNKAALKRLQTPGFVARNELVLDEAPAGIAPRPGRGALIHYKSIRYDHLTMTLNSAGGILLFDDIYNAGWKAYVDGREVPVLHADYAFMAAPIPPGRHKVVWDFTPRYFVKGAYVTAVGVVIFFILLGTFSAVDRRRRYTGENVLPNG